MQHEAGYLVLKVLLDLKGILALLGLKGIKEILAHKAIQGRKALALPALPVQPACKARVVQLALQAILVEPALKDHKVVQDLKVGLVLRVQLV